MTRHAHRARLRTATSVTGFSGAVRLRGDHELRRRPHSRPRSVTLDQRQVDRRRDVYRADETSINRGNVNLYALPRAHPAEERHQRSVHRPSGPLRRGADRRARARPRCRAASSARTGTPATPGRGPGRSTSTSTPPTTGGTRCRAATTLRITSSDPAASTPDHRRADERLPPVQRLARHGRRQTLTVTDRSQRLDRRR